MQKSQLVCQGNGRTRSFVIHQTARTRFTAPKAATFSSGNTVKDVRLITEADSPANPRPGFSYVNLEASAADFGRVMARLEAASLLPAEARAKPAASIAGLQSQAVPSPWGALLSGLMDSLRGGGLSQTPSPGATTASSSLDEESHLSRAVVMFTATWCGPCSIVYREMQAAAARLQGRPPTAILVVDVEENKELASQLGIKALPTLLYLGPDGSRGPIFTQGPVSASFILDALERAASFGGRDMSAKWLKL
ncbi:hypothetical protein Agub_g13234 [Astrephomene gubernaculifera]|uniref:Thioredoxin domain-containing protein n=1 Tax=Astrephomene gubernaculifera TaxID=47775 RepID=A0AAD3HS50_9CHLO|nr:hypothetical protein Agub_g13234 [Astrephomene gubernaculifera]